jgi:hypothetical protein
MILNRNLEEAKGSKKKKKKEEEEEEEECSKFLLEIISLANNIGSDI